MKLNKYLIVSVALAGALSMVSCNDDDTYDVYGNPDNLVFAPDKSTTATVVQTPVGTFGSLDFSTQAQCNQKAITDIAVSFTVDNSLIDAYNEAKGTSYVAIPDGALVMTNSTVTIPQGAYTSSEKFTVTLTEDVNALAAIDNEAGYLVPIVIESCNGAGAKKAESVKSTSYIVISVSHNVIDETATIDNRKGTPVTDRSGWSVEVVQGDSDGNLSDWFDDDASSTAAVSNSGSDPAIVIIDLGREYAFDGMRAYVHQDYGWGGWDEGSFNSTKLYISSDKSEWTSVGTTDGGGWSGVEFVGFYGAINARYIKLEQPKANQWYDPEFSTGDLNIYATN